MHSWGPSSRPGTAPPGPVWEGLLTYPVFAAKDRRLFVVLETVVLAEDPDGLVRQASHRWDPSCLLRLLATASVRLVTARVSPPRQDENQRNAEPATAIVPITLFPAQTVDMGSDLHLPGRFSSKIFSRRYGMVLKRTKHPSSSMARFDYLVSLGTFVVGG